MDSVFVWCAAVGGSLLVLQFLFLLIGGDHGGTDHGLGGDGHSGMDPGHDQIGFLKMLSLQSATAFATFFGLAGMYLHGQDASTGTATGVAIVAGIAAFWLTAKAMQSLAKLQSSGTLDLAKSLGAEARVYLRIPAESNGHGRVLVAVQGRTIEVRAQSRGVEIPTGARVRVTEVVGDDTVVVEAVETAAAPAPAIHDKRTKETPMTALFALPLAPQGPLEGNTILMLAAVAGALFLFALLMLVVKRYKRCPSNKILVIYGRVKAGDSARCLHGGGAFVWPLIQDYAYLSLDPMQIEIPLRGALSAENIRVNVPSVFTVAIGTGATVMQTAAVRLLGLDTRQVMKQAEDIILGQLRQVIASMTIEDINRNRDKFLENVQSSLLPELEKIGLVLINVNITDITDESGYIEAMGRKAASEAIQQAEIDVAQQQKRGSIGVADARREQDVEVASAEKIREIGTKTAEREKLVRLAELDKETQVGKSLAEFERQAQVKTQEQSMRIQVAEAEAQAVTGENVARARMADAEATLKVKQAEAFQLAETRRREADAAVRQAQYLAEARAAEAMAQKIENEQRAELEAAAKAQKARLIVDAEAKAEQVRLAAQADAAAMFAKLEAQARGEYEMLAKKAEGLKLIVDGCGGAQQAFQMLMLEQLPQLAETAAKAIANVKFDKVVVWDGGGGVNGSSTANFLQSLSKSLPPMLHMLQDIGGVKMPDFLGKLQTEPEPAVDGAATTTVAAAGVAAAARADGKPPRA